jgi:acyl carrier protein
LKEEIKEWLVRWFTSRGKIGTQENSAIDVSLDDVDYFAAGWLTSMEVVEFVTDIEDRFSMQFSDRDLQDPRFVTLAGLNELILQHSTQTSDSR